VNFNDPVNQDAPHSLGYEWLMLHVPIPWLVEHFRGKVVLHDVSGKFCYFLWIRSLLLVAFLHASLQMCRDAFVELLVDRPELHLFRLLRTRNS
jgi:hypothetical protein